MRTELVFCKAGNSKLSNYLTTTTTQSLTNAFLQQGRFQGKKKKEKIIHTIH